MKPWEIAARVCRPMSTEEALRLSAEKHGFREFGDIDPEIEDKFRKMLEKIEREKAAAMGKDHPSGKT
ncbi:hypothetical protein ACFJIX_17525 [Roseateles sp. UC29_93]|uniref:hypothetical protein n=1 Tax=Roseateles sp. UC29_93 TaxID=3350177 RepID=UPI003671DACC